MDDRIYPRVRSKIGSKFQADIPPGDETEQPLNARASGPSSQGRTGSTQATSMRDGRSFKAKGKTRSGTLQIKNLPFVRVTRPNQSASGGSLSIAPLESATPGGCRSYERVARGSDDTVTSLFSQPNRHEDNTSKQQYKQKSLVIDENLTLVQ